MKKTVYTLAVALSIVTFSALDGWAAGFGEANALSFLTHEQPLLISCGPQQHEDTTPKEESVVPEELQQSPAADETAVDEAALIGGDPSTLGETLENPFALNDEVDTPAP